MSTTITTPPPSGRSLSHLYTKRWRNRKNWYDDTKRMRFVVYRRHGDVERKTSYRYREESYDLVRELAESEAERIRNWPGDDLERFRFSEQ